MPLSSPPHPGVDPDVGARPLPAGISPPKPGVEAMTSEPPPSVATIDAPTLPALDLWLALALAVLGLRR